MFDCSTIQILDETMELVAKKSLCPADACLLARASDERQGAAPDRQWCDDSDGRVGAQAGASDLPGAHSLTWARDSDRLHHPEDVPLSHEAGMLDT